MLGKKQNIHPKLYAIKKKIIVVISLVNFFANPLLIFLTPINTFSTPIKALPKDNMATILSGKYLPTIPRKNDIVAIIITLFLPNNDNQIFVVKQALPTATRNIHMNFFCFMGISLT